MGERREGGPTALQDAAPPEGLEAFVRRCGFQRNSRNRVAVSGRAALRRGHWSKAFWGCFVRFPYMARTKPGPPMAAAVFQS